MTVDNVDATAEALHLRSAARSLMPPMDIPGVGRLAVLQDPQGAALNVITYAQRRGR